MHRVEGDCAAAKRVRQFCTAFQFEKGDFKMAAKRILYVNYNPATLVRDEQLLMREGYELDSVFGADGVMTCGSVAEYDFVLIDDACPSGERKKLVAWLTANFPKPKFYLQSGFRSVPSDNSTDSSSRTDKGITLSLCLLDE